MGDSRLLGQLKAERYTDERFGLPTVQDILKELDKPGRDPRPEFTTASFQGRRRDLKDLAVGMILEGVVTNVTNFGALTGWSLPALFAKAPEKRAPGRGTPPARITGWDAARPPRAASKPGGPTGPERGLRHPPQPPTAGQTRAAFRSGSCAGAIQRTAAPLPASRSASRLTWPTIHHLDRPGGSHSRRLASRSSSGRTRS